MQSSCVIRSSLFLFKYQEMEYIILALVNVYIYTICVVTIQLVQKSLIMLLHSFHVNHVPCDIKLQMLNRIKPSSFCARTTVTCT